MSLGRSPASRSDCDKTNSELRCCLASVESVTMSTTFDFFRFKIISQMNSIVNSDVGDIVMLHN